MDNIELIKRDLMSQINTLSFEAGDKNKGLMTRAIASTKRDVYLDVLRMVKDRENAS